VLFSKFDGNVACHYPCDVVAFVVGFCPGNVRRSAQADAETRNEAGDP
jgi:hypothetical protein